MNTKRSIRALTWAVLLTAITAYGQMQIHIRQFVNKAVPAVTVSGTPILVNEGTPIVWQSIVQGIPLAPATGTVSFTAVADAESASNLESSGPVPLVERSSSSAPAGGSSANAEAAQWAMPTATPGQYRVTSAYSGDGNYTPASELSSPVAVLPPADFSLTVPAALTVKAGQSVNVPVKIDSINDWQGTVNLSCGQGVTAVSCNLGLKALTIKMPANAFQILTPTPASATTSFVLGTTATIVTTVSGGFLMFFLVGDRRKRGWKRTLSLALAGMAVFAVMTGCGGMRYLQSNGTPRGTYKISVTGTSGTLKHTQVVTLVVE